MANTIKPDNKTFVANPSPFAKFIVYVSFILIIPWIWYVIAKNRFLKLEQAINETASDIDVQLRRRASILVKLLDATKGYMKYEKDLLTEVTKIRSSSNNLTNSEFVKINEELSKVKSGINVVLENYPDLKANSSVLELQNAITDCEDNIAAATRFYNANVRTYNSYMSTFPSNVAASSLNLQSKEYFEATPEERKDVKIDFSF